MLKSEKSLKIFKAMSDSSRLMILNSLTEKEQYVEEIAERFNLAASTVSFHLKKLEDAGLVLKRKQQYYFLYKTNNAIFNSTLADLISFENNSKKVQEERINKYRLRILKTYFKKGKLVKIPAQHKKRMVILSEILSDFVFDKEYDEKEVDRIIKNKYADYCSIRREFIDRGMMRREKGKYWLIKDISKEVSSSNLTEKRPDFADKVEMKGKDKMENRTEIKKRYKETIQPMGIFQIKNERNGKIFICKSTNLPGTFNRYDFVLRAGSCVVAELQKDWNEIGEKSFTFSVLDELKPKEGTDIDYRSELVTLEEMWLEKLKPYGEKGYNKPPRKK